MSARVSDVLYAAKAVAALVSGIATALLGIFAEGPVGQVLTVVVAVCGAVIVYALPNRTD